MSEKVLTMDDVELALRENTMEEIGFLLISEDELKTIYMKEDCSLLVINYPNIVFRTYSFANQRVY